MTSKELILQNIRNAGKPPSPELPEVTFDVISYQDLYRQFCDTLESVGGEAIMAENLEVLGEKVKEIYPAAQHIVCNVEGVQLTGDDGNSYATAHELSSVDVAVVKGEFAVAENGAVWVKNQDNRHRALYFLANNLIIIVGKNELVSTMHEAYERISFEKPGYGTFISGPSKTADIEQSLVIGAHGPKSAYVVFI